MNVLQFLGGGGEGGGATLRCNHCIGSGLGGVYATGHEVVIGEETQRAGVAGFRGQSCNQPPRGRLIEFLNRFQVLGALEVVREGVIFRHGFQGVGVPCCRIGFGGFSGVICDGFQGVWRDQNRLVLDRF